MRTVSISQNVGEGIRIDGISKCFGKTKAVDSVSLSIPEGEFLTLLGPSGCGKTTLLRIIAGFTKPLAGEVFIRNKKVTELPPRLRELGFVFQSYALFPTMTVAENIAFGPQILRWPKARVNSRIEELCSLIHLDGMQGRYPHELSGGQQQRVALARALALEPSILLLDEPLSALDARIRVNLRNEIRSIVKRLNTTAIYVTHDQEEALSISDRIAVMNAGKFEQVGSPMEIYLRPATRFVADFIGTTNWLPLESTGIDCVSVFNRPLPMKIRGSILSDGNPCYLSIRPEHISLIPAKAASTDFIVVSDSGEPSDSPTFPGRLLEFSFLGQHVRALVATPGNDPIAADIPVSEWTRLGLRVGEELLWQIRTEFSVVFANDQCQEIQREFPPPLSISLNDPGEKAGRSLETVNEG